MNIKQALLHNTGWKIFTMLFTFVNNIIIVRLLGAGASAGFFYTLAIFTLISTILRFGLENGIVYYTSKYPERTGPLAAFLSGAVIVETAITYVVLQFFIEEIKAYTLLWSIVFVISNVLVYYITAFYQVKKMYISINVSSLVITFIQMLILLFFYFSGDNILLRYHLAKNINDAVLIITAAPLFLQMIWLAVYFYKANKNDFRKLKPDAVSVKEIFSYSAMNFAAAVLMFLVMRADFYFVEKYCSDVTLGNYVQIAKIGQMALVFPGLLGGVIFPFTVNAADNFTEKISFFCRLITLLFVALLFAFLVAGKYIFVWLLGADFSLMYKGLAGTFAGVYCLAMSLILISYFEGKNKQKIILLSAFISLVIILAGDYLFVPKYGYMAAAITFSAANFAGMIILLIYFLNKTSVPLKQIFLFTSADTFIFRVRKR